jgi:carbon-monoxide dehydrogenase medium subunit
MHDFIYHRPNSLAEAAKILGASADGRLVAGGMTLIPTLKQRLAQPSDLIDLGGIAELKGIKREGNNLAIGALTLHSDIADSAEVKKSIPALAHLASIIGDPAVRNRGTIGGSIANADPAADYPAAVLALGATIATDKRKIAADGFFKALFETALEPGEILTSISFPIPEKAGYDKFPNPASRYAIVGVFVAKTSGGVRVAVTGAGPSAFRVKSFEDALAKNFAPSALDGLTVPAAGLNSDIHASAEYRAHLVGIIAKRAVAAAG